MSQQELIDGVLSLPLKDRTRISKIILKSLDEEDEQVDEAEIQREWGKVAQRRLEELRSGKVKGIPGEQVFAEMRKLFDKQISLK